MSAIPVFLTIPDRFILQDDGLIWDRHEGKALNHGRDTLSTLNRINNLLADYDETDASEPEDDINQLSLELDFDPTFDLDEAIDFGARPDELDFE